MWQRPSQGPCAPRGENQRRRPVSRRASNHPKSRTLRRTGYGPASGESQRRQVPRKSSRRPVCRVSLTCQVDSVVGGAGTSYTHRGWLSSDGKRGVGVKRYRGRYLVGQGCQRSPIRARSASQRKLSYVVKASRWFTGSTNSQPFTTGVSRRGSAIMEFHKNESQSC